MRKREKHPYKILKLFLKSLDVFGLRHIIRIIFNALTLNPLIFPELEITDYDGYHEKEHGYLERAHSVESWIEQGSTLLDVGCGSGLIAEYLAKKRNLQVYGLDVSKTAVKKCRNRGIEAYVQDLNVDPFIEGEYDYVLLMEVLEHLIKPEKTLLSTVRAAKKGVIVTIPNAGFIKWRLHMLRGYFPRQSWTHLHFWSIRDFEAFLKKIGLKPIAFKTIIPNIKETLLKKAIMKNPNLWAWQQCWLIAPLSKK